MKRNKIKKKALNGPNKKMYNISLEIEYFRNGFAIQTTLITKRQKANKN